MRFVCLVCLLYSSFISRSEELTRKDSLRGFLSDIRSCYDVNYYDLKISVDDIDKALEKSSNEIYFTALSDFSWIQVDLAANMEIVSIYFEGKKIEFSREYDAVYVYFNRLIEKGEKTKILINYYGYPKEAVNPPWDGGFVWEKDINQNSWIGVSCQGSGASLWWPCKDHQSDKPDSMKITISARYPLKIISNGNQVNDSSYWDNYFNCWMNSTEWFVSYPINTYNVTLNIGNYVQLKDIYVSEEDTLNLDYYVLDGNQEKASHHFKQVKPMLACFENYFGKYPFWEDGYSLIESPYLGMEHQSAIAYGNKYMPGYLGNTSYIDDLSFDFIIVHETGHEWWGNSITSFDIADMWIHEGFCTYSEALYVECLYGYQKMLSYVNNQKKNIKNDKPIIGPYNVNQMGSSDMYAKASVMLHTLRTLVDNDDLWFKIIRDINIDFKHNITTTKEMIKYLSLKTNLDLNIFFEQYLNNKEIPQFEYSIEKQGKNVTLICKWNAIQHFNMPIKINTGQDDFWIYPTTEIREIDLGSFDLNSFKIRQDLFLIDIKKT